MKRIEIEKAFTGCSVKAFFVYRVLSGDGTYHDL